VKNYLDHDPLPPLRVAGSTAKAARPVRKAKDMTTTGGGDTARRVEKASTPSSAQKQCAKQKQARRFDLAHRRPRLPRPFAHF
jgi:hypothetical protein